MVGHGRRSVFQGRPSASQEIQRGSKDHFLGCRGLGSISVSGLSLLFPFDLPLFSATFTKINALGLPQLFGYGDLPTALGPQQEMQLAQLWHGIVAFLFMAIILAHIYLGTIGMERAFDAMGSGEVDVQWAKEHHGLWYDEVMQSDVSPKNGPAPAE